MQFGSARNAFGYTLTCDARAGSQAAGRRRCCCIRMERIWNLIRIESNILEISKRNRISNPNIQWLQIRLEYWKVSRCLAATRRHPVAMGTSPWMSRRQCGRTRRSFCLLSDLTMKTTSYSRQTSRHISYEHTYTHIRLQNKIIYIPVKNKFNKTNTRETRHGLRWLLVKRWSP